jgi:hypothetical protein
MNQKTELVGLSCFKTKFMMVIIIKFRCSFVAATRQRRAVAFCSACASWVTKLSRMSQSCAILKRQP